MHGTAVKKVTARQLGTCKPQTHPLTGSYSNSIIMKLRCIAMQQIMFLQQPTSWLAVVLQLHQDVTTLRQAQPFTLSDLTKFQHVSTLYSLSIIVTMICATFC